jgi:glycosyltransferase involved in cell wall biosynthesis
MRQTVESSALMRDWPTHQIPHVIDCDAFAPMDMQDARQALGLPQGVPLVLFLASAGIHDERKGWDLLDAALHEVRTTAPDVEVVIVGPSQEGYRPSSGARIHWRGTVQGDEALRLHYSAANVTAVPSREDNMPLTAMEAQSCGRAVVAFDLGGLPDIVDHEHSGYLAPPLDTGALGDGLRRALDDSRGAQAWQQKARERAVSTWSRTVVNRAYMQVFMEALSSHER